jgi:hypothetical protein
MVADERQIGAAGDGRGRLVRVGPVADRVAEAPELVDPLALDRLEDGGQRSAVRMNVGEDRDAQG